MSKVIIPFLSRFKEPMLSGQKTTTARTRKFGNAGDKFIAFGYSFELVKVETVPLSKVATSYYSQEGFYSKHEFISVWELIHPIKGYDPRQVVWLHQFKVIK
jgi:hypothetical protein